MYAKSIAIWLFVSVLSSGVLSHPPLQLEPQIGGFPDHKINLGKWGAFGNNIRARLPTNVIPSHYAVDIIPVIYPDEADFKSAPGHVKITVECADVTDQIVLNSVDIEIGLIKVASLAGVDVPVSDHALDPEAQTLTIKLSAPLVLSTEYTIDIDFVARVADDRRDGLYLSTYEDGGVTKYDAATQFEDIHARKAFPCFDEPHLKAIFRFRIGRRRDGGFHSLWNMDIDQTILNPDRAGFVWDEYLDVPKKMPTYLLAIVVSDYEEDVADGELYEKPVKTWGPKSMMDNSDHGAFASYNAAKILAFFETYLDFPYEFPKMDSVAVPVFSAGAMENWGLNLYQTYYLLLTEESTQLEKWNMASVLAHELSHQWWGNLVTMKWWNDLWLNEGFANYMQFHGANAASPEFQPLQRVTIDTTQRALDFDAGADSKPIHLLDMENPTAPPTRIVYDKGASIIRMMNAFLKKDTFLKGLQNYLKAKAYSNAEQDELFQHLTAQGLIDETLPVEYSVKQIMDTWTLQAGYPIVRVTRASATKLYFTQESFVNNPSIIRDQDDTWYVPIAYITKAEPEVDVESLAPKLWIDNDVLLKSHTVATTSEWVLLNPDAQSYYRVLYDDPMATLLLAQLADDHTQIPTLSRAQLLDDYFKSAFAGYTSIKEALKFTEYLDKEDELPVWTTAFNNLRKLLTVLSESSFGTSFNSHLIEEVSPPLNKIGLIPVADESPVITLLRTQLLDWSCALGHEYCSTAATQEFQKWIADPTNNPIWPDFQPMLYCAAVARGTEVHWDFVLGKYKETTASTRQQGLLLNALACTMEEDRIASLIAMAEDPASDIRVTHAVTLLEKIAASQDGRRIVYDYIKTNTQAILDNTRLGKAAISRVAIALSTYFSSEEDKADVEKFLNDNLGRFDAELQTSLRTAIANIEANINLLAVHGPGLTEFFATR